MPSPVVFEVTDASARDSMRVALEVTAFLFNRRAAAAKRYSLWLIEIIGCRSGNYNLLLTYALLLSTTSRLYDRFISYTNKYSLITNVCKHGRYFNKRRNTCDIMDYYL